MKKKNIRPFVCVALLLGSASMTVLGVITGQNGEVLEKAIKICLECIGIG